MKPETNTVQELFERDVRYSVPLYQRPYVWKQDEQWAPLWDDLATVLEHHAQGDSLTHFLGAVVLDQERTNPGEIPRFTVIDGQQRLTTLQILLAAAAAGTGAAGADDDAEILRDLLVNSPKKSRGLDQLKVWPTNSDRDAFARVIRPEGVTLSPSSGSGPDRIGAAFDYFGARVTRFLETGSLQPIAQSTRDAEHGTELDDSPGPGPTESSETRAKQLRVALTALLKLVTITLGEDDNAQVIFETLNARGTPLLALDLVKNVLFHRASRQDGDGDGLYENVWKPQLDDEYWRKDRRQGRLNRPAGDLFLVHWLTMELKDVIPATELFTTFRTRVLRPDTDAAALIRQLATDAATMRSFDSLSAEYTFFERLPALDANIVLPLALLLFRSTELSERRRRRALRMVESWLARRALTRLTAKNYNRQIPRLIQKIGADVAHADDVLLRELGSGEGEISRWPSDEDVRRFLLSNDAYGVVARPRLVMALTAVEKSLYGSKTDVVTVPSDLTIEHLMPQDWEEHWPLAGPDGSPLEGQPLLDAADRRSVRINRLGNLTLVAGGLNSAMRNSAWTVKRPELNRHSRLLLNARLDSPQTFDEAAIDARGEWLVDRILTVWPGPDHRDWDVS